MHAFPKVQATTYAKLEVGGFFRHQYHQGGKDKVLYAFKLRDNLTLGYSGAMAIMPDKSCIYIQALDIPEKVVLQYLSWAIKPDMSSFKDMDLDNCRSGSLIYKDKSMYIPFVRNARQLFLSLNDFSVSDSIGHDLVISAQKWEISLTDEAKHFDPISLLDIDVRGAELSVG
jgi:hypothetical protein